MENIIFAVLVLGAIAIVFGLILSVAAKVFEVKVDERLPKIQECLAGANCGGCGYPGCAGCAEAILAGKAPVTACAPAGAEGAAKIAAIMGMEAPSGEKMVAHVICNGGDAAVKNFEYVGIADCVGALKVAGGPTACSFGCLGFGSCVSACQFDALHINDKGVAEVDKVVGVIAKDTENKTYIQYNAKAVLIATGGYAGNQDRLHEHFGNINVWPLCNELSDGKGYDIVIAAGGIADRNWALCCNEFGGVNGKMEERGRSMVRSNDTLRFAIYGGLMVDPNGDRFMNEQYLSDRPLALGGEMSLRVGKYYAVVDQTMYEECRDKGVLAYFGNPADWYVGSTGYTEELLPNLDEHMDIAIQRGWAVKGSLADCAKAFGLTDLEQTVADYNAACAAGKDEQFYKNSYLLRELTGDTFYVIEYEPSIWGTFGGVKTDSYARAVNAEQQPIQGLYVAGVDNGSIYASPYYENEGAALGTAYTSGIVAADCMISDLKNA